MSVFRLLNPKSIAVFGGQEAAEVINQLQKAGYEGHIWPVHPSKQEIHGIPAFRHTGELPSAPDIAYLAVNKDLTVKLAGELADLGCGAAICYANGFSEAGEEGKAREARLLQAARDMIILGPNCYGLLNYLKKAPIWPDQHGGVPVDRGVALITQSSNVALNLTMQRRGLPIATVLSLGNRAQFDLAEAIEAFARMEEVTAIGLYLETVSDPHLFEQAASIARTCGKPIVALKTGKSSKAQAIALSHTASLAGADELVSALFRRCGVGRVTSMEALLETLKILHIAGPLNGFNLAAMSPSGGDGALVADACEGTRLKLAELSDLHYSQVKLTVHEQVSVSNPFDYQLFDWSNELRLSTTFHAFLQGNFDLTICMFDFPREDRCSDAAWRPAENALLRAAEGANGPVAVLSVLPEGMPESKATAYIDAGIIPLSNLETAIAAVAVAAEIGGYWQAAKRPALHAQKTTIALASEHCLDEASAKRLLSGWGLQVPNSRVVSSAFEGQAVADQLHYPLVVKGLGIAHKTDVGAVRLNLANAEEVADAITQMQHLSSEFLLEEMVTDSVAELIIGVMQDAQFGSYLVIGAGGILVELLQDSVPLLLPTSREDIESALSSLRTAPLLNGFRGRPNADLNALIEAILAVGDMVIGLDGNITELDINPLMVRPQGYGAVVADALIRTSTNVQEISTFSAQTGTGVQEI